MAQFPAFPLWTDAYLGDTTHLTTLEHGAYLLLLIVAWRSKDGTLPDDEILLARYCKLRLDHWRKIRHIIEPFFTIKDGRWIQGRLKDELESVKLLSNSQSRKAKGRWVNESKAKSLKNSNTNNADASSGHMPDECRSDASPTPTPTPTPKVKKSIKKVAIVSLDDLSVDHVKEWLSEKRAQGKYLQHNESEILETFKNYCISKGKKYENYIAAYRNAFEWDRCQPRAIQHGQPDKHQRTLEAAARGHIRASNPDF